MTHLLFRLCSCLHVLASFNAKGVKIIVLGFQLFHVCPSSSQSFTCSL